MPSETGPASFTPEPCRVVVALGGNAITRPGDDGSVGQDYANLKRSLSSVLSLVQRGYQDVYTDYRGHAEEVLETDEIPSGYRFYVRRYFQLIRPREGGDGQPQETPSDE